ncbi:MAG: hypothetical protein A2521_04410 [Deltaproteobacteria bacterium RIFOXYD12_FULL_57_12]|nr:MAG: hypothetical protein A2521_04410 [Deltaproteobacteria bacterium RIFOXYD12_FULL_57_12]
MKVSARAHILLLAASVALAYGNAVTGPFQFDDYNVIVNNPAVHSWPAWWRDLGQGGIRPLLKLSYLLNWLTGWGAVGFHLVNVALHGANTVLVYLLGCRLAGRYLPADPARVRAVALAGALVFALHPVQTEAVTYICGRSVSLMSFFYFASLLSYIDGRAASCRLRTYLLSPFLFGLALAVKEVAVTLPVALLLWEATGQRPDRRPIDFIAGTAVHWLLLLAGLAALAMHDGYRTLLWFSLQTRSIAANLLSEVNGITYLLSCLVWPQRLDIDPDLPVLTALSLPVVAEFCLLLLLVVVAICWYRRMPWLTFGVFWFFLHLAPTNSLVPRLDIANERQLYLAGWGFFMILAMAGTSQPIRRPVSRLGFSILCCLLLAATVSRNLAYVSEIALWEDTARNSPGRARVHNNLGYAYYLAGRFPEAQVAYLEALRLAPDFRLARSNLALLPAPMNRGNEPPEDRGVQEK